MSDEPKEERTPTEETELDESPTPVEGVRKPPPSPPPARAPSGEHTGMTLPPNKRHIQVLAHTVIDALAIGAIAWLGSLKIIGGTESVLFITAIAGAWLGGAVFNGGGGASSLISNLVTGLARRGKRK